MLLQKGSKQTRGMVDEGESSSLYENDPEEIKRNRRGTVTSKSGKT